eukprot:Gb_38800 [translate_table: standard]
MNNGGEGATTKAEEKPNESATADIRCQFTLEALEDITLCYLKDLGKDAHYYANLASRTHCNVFDVIQTFSPVNEAAKHGFNQVEAVHGLSRKPCGQALPDDRLLVNFKFGFGKKVIAAHMALGIKNAPPYSSWHGRDEEKDDKKRRAKKILKEAMDNA